MADRGAFKDSELLKTMRRRFKLVNDAEAAQDERERDDIAFEDGEQWPADIQLARQGQSAVSGEGVHLRQRDTERQRDRETEREG